MGEPCIRPGGKHPIWVVREPGEHKVRPYPAWSHCPGDGRICNLPDLCSCCATDLQVTGIRKDPFAQDHRIPVEQDKPATDKGKYLYPQGYGQPASKGIDYERQQQMQAQARPAPGK